LVEPTFDLGVDRNRIHVRLKSGQSFTCGLACVNVDGGMLNAIEKVIDKK
jgi:hypothetical protein